MLRLNGTKSSRVTRSLTAAAAALTLFGVAACGSGGPETGSAGDELEGLEGTIGSKDFAEQYILAHITSQLFNAHGADTETNTSMVGSTNVRSAFETGELDGYWEYTGTAWITYFQETEPLETPEEMFEAVKESDAEDGIHWFDPAPLNNTYSLAILSEKADELGVEKLSDIAGLDPADQTFCIESEFSTRDDGWPGLKEAYDLDIPDNNVAMLDTGVVYTETAKAETCNFGEVFQTDGRISNLDLLVLEDDRNFFPAYQGALTMKQEIVDEYPALTEIVGELSELLTTEVMQELNELADVEGEDPEDIATDWLEENDLV